MKESNEVWLPVPLEGAEGNGYQISTRGRIRNKHGRILKTFPSPTGASRIAFVLDGKRTIKYVGQLVALTFIPDAQAKLEQGLQAVHINHDLADDRLSNIELQTISKKVIEGYKAKRKYCKDYEQEIYDLWYEGSTPEEICEATGVPAFEIRKYLAKNKMRYRKFGSQKFIDQEQAKIRTLYWQEDMNKHEIMKRTGYNNTFIHQALKKSQGQ